MSSPNPDQRPAEGETIDSGNAPAPSQTQNAENSLVEPTPQVMHLRTPGREGSPSLGFSGNQLRSPTQDDGILSPNAQDRVFPVRSVVSVDPGSTSGSRSNVEGYFSTLSHARRPSAQTPDPSRTNTPAKRRQSVVDEAHTAAKRRHSFNTERSNISGRGSEAEDQSTRTSTDHSMGPPPRRQAHQGLFTSDSASNSDAGSRPSLAGSLGRQLSEGGSSFRSVDEPGLMTTRFKHVVTEDGHAVITGRDGDAIQRCEDEPIHIPGAVQGFGMLIAFEEQQEGKLIVRVVSENSRQFIGYSPGQLFRLESFTDILSEEQADNLLDHVDFIREEDADVETNGPEVFTVSIKLPGGRKSMKFWCAMHINQANSNLIICEFEFEDDQVNPLVPPNEFASSTPQDTLQSNPTEEEYHESTQTISKPLRVLRSARKRKGEAAAMEVFNVMSQVQEQLAAAANLEQFLKILVGVVKELTGFHRVMIYQFDQAFNGKVVTELVDPQATKDLYKGLNFPASDIPKQARDLYKINKVRMLYDRDQTTARLVCRTTEDLETPLDLTFSYLRAMSPIHLKYLGHMAVRSSMSISINAFDELWGLIACHGYGDKGMRVSFPIRKMCRLVGDSASRNIERLSYASRLQARKLINTVPTSSNPSGYIIASSEDLLKLFDADFGVLSIRGETKILGHLEQTQEALAMLEYLRMRNITSVMTSQDLRVDFPDLRYEPGFKIIAGLLLVPLSAGGQDFIVFFRKGQLSEIKWAGNPYEKTIKEGTQSYLEPRKSFKTWSETVVGKCREWTEEEIETAAVLCLVYGKFIEVWRQKEAALQNSQLTRLLLANSAHEVRTPLNAIINYLEIALEGSLDEETRGNLAKSHSASKSLIYVINDLLDLTKTEEGGELVKDEVFDLKGTLFEATDMFKGDAKRKKIAYEVASLGDLPGYVQGDQRRIRQAISNITANAIQSTSEGGIKIEMYMTKQEEREVEIEVSVSDTGVGISSKKLDALFRELEQVQSESEDFLSENVVSDATSLAGSAKSDGRTLGLGLAVVARIVRNMNGQLRLKSEEGKGTRFVLVFPFELPSADEKVPSIEGASSTSPAGSTTPLAGPAFPPGTPPIGEMVTLVDRSSPVRTLTSDVRRSKIGSRKNSSESVNSKKSLNSLRSNHSSLSKASMNSGKSDADRLIEAIQEPSRVQGWDQRPESRSGSLNSPRPRLEKSYTSTVAETSSSPHKFRARSLDMHPVAPQLREHVLTKPGESSVIDSGQPVKPVRMADDNLASPSGTTRTPLPTSSSAARNLWSQNDAASQTTDNMRVLVAEDDPVNSRIIKKRLETLRHEVHLTVNGEECAHLHQEKVGFFDMVLMDMQMPIVDGLTSTKMIRSFEKTSDGRKLSPRAALNRRVPIIAVSASLIERERQTYIDAGFDGWILKPISFARLSEIMKGLVDKQLRQDNLYQPGRWEQGGWFDKPDEDVFMTGTGPDSMDSISGNAEGSSLPTSPPKAHSLPEVGSMSIAPSGFTSTEPVASPGPIIPGDEPKPI